MGDFIHSWMISIRVVRTLSGFDCIMSMDDGSAARNVSSALDPKKPKHSGKKSIEQRGSSVDDDDEEDVAQPAHMAALTKLFHLEDVEQTCPTAILLLPGNCFDGATRDDVCIDMDTTVDMA